MTATGRGEARRFVGAKRAAGLPDLFMLHDDPPRMIIAEVKGTGGELSDKQREFLQAARLVADAMADDQEQSYPVRVVGVYAWTPADQPIIEQMLRSKVLI